MGYWKAGSKEDKKTMAKETVKDVLTYPFTDIPERNIRKETCEKFGIRVALDEEDGKTITAVYFPYYDQKGKLTGFKKRDLTVDKYDKFHFTTVGKVGVDCKLFGQNVAESVSRKRGNLLYVEGEWDVVSAYKSQVDSVKNTKYSGMEPFVVGLSCGTANAVEATLHNEEFIKSFDSLVLGFDNDSSTPAEKAKGIKRGAETRNDVAGALVGSELGLFVVDYPVGHKDPSDMLQAGEEESLAKLLQFGKRAYSAEKIVKASSISFEELIKPKEKGIIIDEFPGLMEKIQGLRTRELILVTAPSGVGKSTVTSIFASALMRKDERVGMIYLEETNKETLQRMVAAKLKVNYNKFKNEPTKYASAERIKEVYDSIVNDDKLIMLDHFGSLPISELMNKIKHMHLVDHCKYIILDHLSVVISGSHIENERKELDIVMTELAAFCASHDVCVVAVSHINRSAANDFKPPKDKENEPFWVKITKEMMRGSAALEQLSWIIIGLEPQIMPDRSRGKVRLTVLKNRPWSYLGIADTFEVDEDTWEVVIAPEEGY